MIIITAQFTGGEPNMNVRYLHVTVSGWAKFNARTDRANLSWLRFQNNFFSDQAIFLLSHAQKNLYLFFLCEASKKNAADLRLISSYVSSFVRIAEHELDDDIRALVDVGLITVAEGLGVVTPPNGDGVTPNGDGPSPTSKVTNSVWCPTNERTNVTNDTNEHCISQLALAPDGEDVILESQQSEADVPEKVPRPLPELARIWNDCCRPLATIRDCAPGTKRRRQTDARWKTNPDAQYWRSVIERMAASPFCRGENDRAWRASYDFLIRPDTATKVLEGTYDPRHGATKLPELNWEYIAGGKTDASA